VAPLLKARGVYGTRFQGAAEDRGRCREKQMVDPTFMCIGAQKCGTSWLFHNIRQHPEVFVSPKKELHFFDKRTNYTKGIEWYRRQFAGYSGQRAVGEFTPNYFWTSTEPREIEESDLNRDIPKLVHNHYPDIKLVLSLRNPVDRAISAYYHLIRMRLISPHSRILDVKDRYGIVSMGFYALHLSRWREVFPPDQFLILLYEEDIAHNKEQTLRRVYRFIGVDDSFKPHNLEAKHNTRSNYFYMRTNYYSRRLAKKLESILPAALRNSNLWTIPVYAKEIEELTRIYQTHNEQLSTLIGRQLP
jgi:hypothetical protein